MKGDQRGRAWTRGERCKVMRGEREEDGELCVGRGNEDGKNEECRQRRMAYQRGLKVMGEREETRFRLGWARAKGKERFMQWSRKESIHKDG